MTEAVRTVVAKVLALMSSEPPGVSLHAVLHQQGIHAFLRGNIKTHSRRAQSIDLARHLSVLIRALKTIERSVPLGKIIHAITRQLRYPISQPDVLRSLGPLPCTLLSESLH